MAVDGIIRVSFQSNTPANQAANKALVGQTQGNIGSGPFAKIGTAVYTCSNAHPIAVAQSLADLGEVLLEFADTLDFVSISIAKRDIP